MLGYPAMFLLWVATLWITVFGKDVSKGKTEYFSLMHVIPAQEAITSAILLNNERENIDELFSAKFTPSMTFTQQKSFNLAILNKNDYISTLRSSGEDFEGEEEGVWSRLPAVLPNPNDHETIFNFAQMAANSYLPRTAGEWRNSSNFDSEDGFGWNSIGLRGHIFANKLRSIVIISFKGTSTILHGGDTVAKDKYMDNIMFSCCCARVDLSWTPVCGCYQGSASGKALCDTKCLQKVIREDEESYFRQGLSVAQLVMAKYPKAQIWFTGHSLGGAIAALMSIRLRNTAAITFSSPGPYLYAKHLGLDLDEPGKQWRYPVWNFGLSSDPIFMGTCTGMATSCYLSGYAIETACRHGMDCLFEVSSWQPDVSTHRIDWLIDHVLSKPEKFPLPNCVPNRVCNDCPNWLHV